MTKVKIYTKSTCPFCHKAKGLLDDLNIPYEEESVDNPEDFENLKQKTGHPTVPQIFFDDELIGGCDNLFEKYENGELDKLTGAE